MQKKSFARTAVAAALTAFAAHAALAQSTPPAPPAPPPASGPEAASAATPEASPFTANINLTTKYKFRGQDQGNTKFFSPALQGGFDWSQNGFYLGNWNSNVSFSNAAIEMDFYGGYKGEIAKDLGYDVGVLQYYYPQKDRVINFNTTEIYGALSYLWLTFKTSVTVSKDYFGIGEAQQAAASAGGDSISRPKGRGSLYFELNANYPIVDKLTLNAHAGYTRYASDLRDASYTEGGVILDKKGPALSAPGDTIGVGVPNFFDYKVGVTYDLGSGFSVAGAVVGANKKNYYGDINKARAIFTISKAM